ncbi:MAG: hypothetical protein WA254_18105 [Candidatus Sulfotelmatobacter sp.]
MRYLVRARVKPGREGDLLQAIESETLGQGSVAEGEYLRNMSEARVCADQTVRWWKSAIALHLCRKNGLIGKNISTSRGCKMHTTGASAATKTAGNHGLAATAIAPHGWSRS